MGVVLFKYREGCNDLVISFSTECATQWTILCLVCTPESSALLFKSMATAYWRSHTVDPLPVGRGSKTSVSSKFSYWSRGQSKELDSASEQCCFTDVEIFLPCWKVFTCESSEPHLAKKVYPRTCGFAFVVLLGILCCFPTTHLR